MAKRPREIRGGDSQRGTAPSGEPALRSRASITVAAVLLALAGIVIQQLYFAQSDRRVADGPSDMRTRDTRERSSIPRSPSEVATIPSPDLSRLQPDDADRIRDARAMVVANPTSAGAWAQLAAACDADGIHDCAAKGYGRAYELAPNDIRWLYLFGLARGLQGAPPSELVPLFRTVAGGMPKFAPAHFHLGKALEADGKLEDARDAYVRAVRLSPLDPLFNFAVAEVMLSLGDAIRATQHLLAAAQLAPKDGPVRDVLVKALRRTGDDENARLFADETRSPKSRLKLYDPIRSAALAQATRPEAMFNLTSSLVGVGQYAEAIKQLETIRTEHPTNAQVPLRIAYAHLMSGDLEQADFHFNKFRKLCASTATSRSAAAVSAEEREHLDVVTVRYWNAYLAALLGSGDAKRLRLKIAEFEAVASSLPLDAPAYTVWGDALARIERQDEALERYLEAIAKNPRFADAYHNAATVLEAFGHADEALTFYKRAATLNPRGPSAACLKDLENARPETKKQSETQGDRE